MGSALFETVSVLSGAFLFSLKSVYVARIVANMIGSLRGTIIDRGVQSALLEVQGVGYRVMMSPSLLSSVQQNASVFLYIHEVIREDAHDLYGFLKQNEMDLFLQLLSVSGVGPKVAMTISSIGSAEMVQKAITSGDVDTLTSVPGVGKKTAQKIVLELRGKLVDEVSDTEGEDGEVVSALQSLGYSVQDARAALKKLPNDIKDVSTRLREALKHLSRYGR